MQTNTEHTPSMEPRRDSSTSNNTRNDTYLKKFKNIVAEITSSGGDVVYETELIYEIHQLEPPQTIDTARDDQPDT